MPDAFRGSIKPNKVGWVSPEGIELYQLQVSGARQSMQRCEAQKCTLTCHSALFSRRISRKCPRARTIPRALALSLTGICLSMPPPYGLIRDRLRRGQVIPFLGAGASLKSLQGGPSPVDPTREPETDQILPVGALPTASQLAVFLARKAEFPDDESFDLAKVAQYYSVVGGRRTLNEELHRIFNAPFASMGLHKLLARVDAPLLIVTTNYDDLLEQSLDAAGRAYDRVVHTTDAEVGERVLWWQHGADEPDEILPNKLSVDLTERTVVYKMHGAVDRRDPTRDQYVITEDDYIEFLARMTRNKAIPSVFAEPFQTRHFLFLGYGLRDWNLRVVLNRIDKDLRRPKQIKSWAIQRHPSFLEQRFWQERSVEVYDEPIDDFVQELTWE